MNLPGLLAQPCLLNDLLLTFLSAVAAHVPLLKERLQARHHAPCRRMDEDQVVDLVAKLTGLQDALKECENWRQTGKFEMRKVRNARWTELAFQTCVVVVGRVGGGGGGDSNRSCCPYVDSTRA